MMVVYIILGALAYFLVAGLVTGLLNKVMPADDLDDVTGLAIVFGVIWPLFIPFYLLYLAYEKGWNLMESFLEKKPEINRKP